MLGSHPFKSRCLGAQVRQVSTALTSTFRAALTRPAIQLPPRPQGATLAPRRDDATRRGTKSDGLVRRS